MLLTKICRVCGEEKPKTKFPKMVHHRHEVDPPRENTCFYCREQARKKTRIWKEARRNLERRPKAIARRKRSYRKNLSIRLLSEKRRRLRNKVKVLTLYGGCCANPSCGTTELAILSIDHINDDGYLERRSHSSGQHLYRKLVNKPRRSDLQILCHNCQVRKRLYGADFSTWEAQKQFLPLEV